MFESQQEWIVLGVTESGELFDVPGWAERLCDLALTEGGMALEEGREFLHPLHINGRQAVLVETALQQHAPQVFERVRTFVDDNHLKTRSGRTGSVTSAYPVITEERRYYARG